MTLTLELAPEIQEALLEEARKQETTPGTSAMAALRSRFLKPHADAEATLRHSLARLLEAAETLKPQPLAHTAKYSTGLDETLCKNYRKRGFHTAEGARDAEN